MTWDTIQQLIRILLNAAGMYALGNAVASGDQYQAAIGGVCAVAQFVWWFFYQRKQIAAAAASK